MSKKITISMIEYINLRTEALKLNFLECMGVDNWCGYGEALYPDPDYGDDDFDVARDKMIKEIEEKYK